MDIDLSMPDCSVHAETIGGALIFNRALRRGQMLALGREPQRNLTLDRPTNNGALLGVQGACSPFIDDRKFSTQSFIVS